MNILTDNEIPKIIEIINCLGRDLMNWLGNLNEMVQLVGVPGVIVVLWAVMPLVLTTLLIAVITIGGKQSRQNNRALTQQMESLTLAISNLSDKVLAPPMNLEDSLEHFHLVMGNHVMRELRYLGGILRKNSIHSRTIQIKKNIAKEFKAITISECFKLSKKKTVCGDMGKIVQENINWEKFLGEVYKIFFVKTSTKEEEHLKIQDIEITINSEVDKIAKIIKENGVHN